MFELLKQEFVSPPLLPYPDMSNSFILDTDASGIAAGAVLAHIPDDGEEKPVAYYSSTFKKAEQNCCTTHSELV